MKTVMQEFADKLEKMAITREQEGSACAGVWNSIHHWATQMVDMEKEQMLNAFQESRLTHPMIGFKHETFVDYYNETFKSE
jgi:hypothetical protein